MPNIAVDSGSGDIVLVQDATDRGQYLCVDCQEPVSYVRGHTRDYENKSTPVASHFRYPNCGCYGQQPSGGKPGGGSGGGGNAEDPIHIRRKKTALAEALRRFDDSHHETEYYIGDKRADAVLIFDEAHPEYGKGLAIEYQHKNESKDRRAVEQEYARNEFTTLWLWDEQYDFTSSIPEIDLFGGEVYTPWPDAVPKKEEWPNCHGFLDDIRQKRIQPAITATLPTECVAEYGMQFWRETDWTTLFDPDYYLGGFGYEDVTMEIDFAPFFPEEFWHSAFRDGLNKSMSYTVPQGPPPTPFDDVQCHSCGHYDWYKNIDQFCGNCGEQIDWEWNVVTERISKESAPDGVNIRSELN